MALPPNEKMVNLSPVRFDRITVPAEMRQRLVIYGASYPDVVKLVAAINRRRARWQIVGFLDDRPQAEEFMGCPVLGGGELLGRLADAQTWFFNNVYATTTVRLQVARRLVAAQCQLATLVHPSVDASWTLIGADTIVADGAVLGANARIGEHCAIRSNAVVNHDNVLEDGVFVGPGATLCGHVTVREGAYLGAGCTVKQRVEIGRGSVVGAGALVTRDVPAATAVAGVPARPLNPRP